ncbi:hypothetical protein [Dehalogenimonas sp. 4OHTPN]|uniref:Uncharacterized protein n=1 Tax=Dehalogenimonas sp. 4OHTPN TaxID=3166643 RepID=A0AAU8GC05_9CHLR
MMEYTPQNGLKMLARMIAEAYMEELAEEARQIRIAKQKKEACDAKQEAQQEQRVGQGEQGQSGDKERAWRKPGNRVEGRD